MTKVDEILDELRKGTSLQQIRKDFSSRAQIDQAIQIFLQESEPKVSKLQGNISMFSTQLGDLQSEMERTKISSKRASDALDELEKKIEPAKKKLEHLSKQEEEAQNTINTIESQIREFSGKGITVDFLTRVSAVEAASGEDLLEKVNTASAYAELLRNLDKLNALKKTGEKELASLEEKKEKTDKAIQSQKSLLDEAIRRNRTFNDAIKVTESFLS
ncbi:MAG: hypothetical protein V1850_03970 [Candidatus Bathyarchaeota archaeon]